MINGATKWLIGTLAGIVIAGAGWNENKQWEDSATLAVNVKQTQQDIAVMKQAALDAALRAKEAAEQSKENSDKLDKILHKLDKTK